MKTGEVLARSNLRGSILKRRASLSEAEHFFLHALLIDEPPAAAEDDGADTSQHMDRLEKATKTLDDDTLFTVMPADKIQQGVDKAAASKNPKRPSILELWKAHEDGVAPKVLAQRGSLFGLGGGDDEEKNGPDHGDDASDAASDEEVRHEEKALEDGSNGSSWGEGDHTEHYDTWEVLKDEYAEDFGFDYSARGVSVEDVLNGNDELQSTFQILGTSTDDKSAQPHVLSPPLMESLTNFLPENLGGENFWLRFSMVRDGASLDTLKQYVRASRYTIIAIETPTGEVFGSFTSSRWRNQFGFYGSGPSFVWKMRHSRRTKCYSLFDQAQLESEVDVYMRTEVEGLVQACRRNELSVGGDDVLPNVVEGDEGYSSDPDEKNGDVPSFAIRLDEDLLAGTSSPSATFGNPCLSGSGGTFEVANVEVYTFTPAFDVKSAEKLEMTQFFLHETDTGRTMSEFSDLSARSTPISSEEFYKRVGGDLGSEERRDRWQYMNMMGGTGTDGASRGIGASPRFGY